MLDITTTACLRPEILDKTLSSFKSRMLHDYPARLIVNVDPVGEGSLFDMIEVCRTYFDDVVINAPLQPNFPTAFLWCWQQVRADYVLHLEDDWELLQDVSLPDMLACLDRHDRLAILRLSAFTSTAHTLKSWNKFLDWNGEYFEVREEDRRRIGFCGHPSIIKRRWIGHVLPWMNAEKNPEKQLQFPEYNGLDLLRNVLSWRYGVWAQPESPPAVKDIGRDWIAQAGWQKRGNRAYFTEWERAGV